MDEHVDNRIHEEILTKEYECLICFNGIGPKSPIWNCRACFRVYDLQCIKKWGIKATESRGSWNCPHCLTLQSQKPQNIQYRCWCGKQRKGGSSSNHNKKFAKDEKNSLSAPHSCGQTCGAARSCPHPCPLPCHAGAHADPSQCFYMGPKISCFCGKNSEQTVCSMSKYNGFSCQNKCLKPNRICGHKCQQSCHSRSELMDNCGPCERLVTVSCYCGEVVNQEIKCSNLSRSKRGRLRGKNSLTISCDKICAAPMDCGKHSCQIRCHKASDTAHICARKPRENETCFCNKTRIHRESCDEPRVACDKLCQKRMKCGHICQNRCHPGNCAPCEEIITNVPCRCQLTTQSIICKDRDEPPRCQKKCDATLSCKRHKCRTECCEFSSRKHNRKRPPLPTQNLTIHDMLSGALTNITPELSETVYDEAEEAAHFCPRICGRLLSCSKHTCARPCHSGKCSPCLAASFDEYVCPCGSTVLEPPIRCGTLLPFCRARCHRPQSCGHSASHLCHPDSDPCAECPVMVETPCRCGKSLIKEKCYVVSNPNHTAPKKLCSVKCGELLPCSHVCQQTCCPGNGLCAPCQSMCTHIYDCGHQHQALCHLSTPCPDVCRKKLVAQCPCGVTKCEYECGEDLEVGCTETCLIESYPKILLDAYEYDKRWLLNIEHQIRDFVKQTHSKTLWFKPMSKLHRRFTYYLLEHYGLEGESIDTGAKRSIRAYRTPETRLCGVVLQRASHVAPQLFMDQILLPPSVNEPDEADAELAEGTSLDAPNDGFVEVASRIGSMGLPEEENGSSAIDLPANQFMLLSN